MMLDDRFWSKVTPFGDCWNWSAGLYGDGYGKFWQNGKTQRATRVAYEYLRADIPAGLVLDHLCRNILCVNPWHLEPVTVRVNTLRGVGPSSRNARLTHCVAGHPFSIDNTYKWRSERKCRECGREACRRYQAKRKARAA